MGIFSFFSKEERKKRQFERNMKIALDKNRPPEERYRAMDELRQEGSDEAIYALLKRFTFTVESKGGSVADEEEKEWVFGVIQSFGTKALPPLRRFVVSEEGPAVNPKHSISKALELIKLIVEGDRDYMLEVIKDLVEHNPPGYERNPIRKEEILSFLNEWDDGRAAELILPYLEDMDETIRFLTVQVLFHLGAEDIAREKLLELLTSEEEESKRIKDQILRGFAEHGWSIEGYADGVRALLEGDDSGRYRIHHGKFIKEKRS